MLLVRVVFLLIFNDTLLLELHYKAISDQLSLLGESYIDVLHNLGPLCAGIFRLFYGYWGDNLLIERILAFLLAFFQVAMVTTGINNVNGLKDFNAFTGVIHIVLLHLFPDMLVLTPLLLGMTFITVAYIIILHIIRGRRIDNQNFLLVGICTSIAGGFLFPLFLFAVPTLLIVVIYTKFDARSIGLYIMGILLPLTFILAYYYSKNFATEYLMINMYYGFSLRIVSELSLGTFVLVGFIPSILFVLSFVKILALYNMVSYQQKMIVTALFYLITSLVIILLLPDKSIYHYLLFIPFLIHFYGILFIDTRDKSSLYLLIFSFVAVLIVPFANKIGKLQSKFDFSPMYPKVIMSNYGRILNLSSEKNILTNNSYATGFCEYMIARAYFLDPSPEATIMVNDKLNADLPDAIYDPNGIVKAKFDVLPVLKSQYRFQKSFKIYKKKK